MPQAFLPAPDLGGLSLAAVFFFFLLQVLKASAEKQRLRVCLKFAGEDPQTTL